MSRVMSKDGTSIAFDKLGHGPAVILVDAAGGFRGFGPMAPLAEHLKSSFSVLTYDRRGRGESTNTLPYTVDREVEDLEALIEAAGGSAFVYGFSSGAVLALYAAAQGLAIEKLALLEPPIVVADQAASTSGQPDQPDLGSEIAELVAAGRRSDAVEHFHKSIGVPGEIIEGIQQSPAWPKLESIAHTLAYDSMISKSFPVERLADITTPTLVLASDASDQRLLSWSRGLADALPAASFRAVNGTWHGISEEALAPILKDFFCS
jgi:pimeloyl-ACP methyl ester carboxylesterase